jgi:hypothetical protein
LPALAKESDSTVSWLLVGGRAMMWRFEVARASASRWPPQRGRGLLAQRRYAPCWGCGGRAWTVALVAVEAELDERNFGVFLGGDVSI